MSTADIYNAIIVNDQLTTSGQPTAEQFQSAAAEGFRTVINLALATSDNALAGEPGLVRSLGMAHYHIPVDWERPTSEDFAAFEQLMQQLPPGKTLLHCAANFRATAFYSLYAMKHLGWSRQQAEEFRKPIWQGSLYPVWDAFIARMSAGIENHPKP